MGLIFDNKSNTDVFQRMSAVLVQIADGRDSCQSCPL